MNNATDIECFFARWMDLTSKQYHLSCSNKPSEVLDKALLRPGRFDRRVIVERPDLKGRIETLKVHAKDVKMDETVDFEEIALWQPVELDLILPI